MTQEAIEGKRKWEAKLLSDLSDSTTFNKIIEALAKPFLDSKVDKVACFEALGFPLGAGVARRLNAGLVLVRKTEPENISLDFETETFRDYDHGSSGKGKTFKVLKSSILPETRILIVDDLCETGEQLKAAKAIFTRLHATIIGAAFISCVRSKISEVKEHPVHDLNDEPFMEVLPHD